jgi:hypothetical protein
VTLPFDVAIPSTVPIPPQTDVNRGRSDAYVSEPIAFYANAARM